MAATLGLAATLVVARPAAAQYYEQHNLQTNATEPTLLNAWGLVSSPTSPWWVVNNGDDSSTLFTGAGARAGNNLRVSVPGGPTGIVFNGTTTTTNFQLPTTGSPVARFIFATEGGEILGWAPPAPGTPPATAATSVVPASPAAIYKGLAINATFDRIYATNFKAGTVDTYDATWQPILPNGFMDPTIPQGYAPFGIQTIGTTVYVTYALQDDDQEDDVAGVGHGFVNAFDTDGNLIRRVASRGPLNSPWGIALAPGNFGEFSNDLLIGNFGDGKIQAFNPASILGNGQYERAGILHSAGGPPLQIEGLWALSFGKGVNPATGLANSGNTNSLYFTAGPDEEKGGLFGFLTEAPVPED
jgi:uncharacterized protein (TIGR03118 family)